ncbi:MAG: LacI family transcriptional regulator [Spartobacteria bacterium]|nr:LacI family transcriptional regulator [Spartobacteria bacterium]
MKKRPTINDIAAECGVSLSTVSLVLNNNPRISEKTRLKVLAAVEKYQYQPNTQARALASRSSRSLSVIVPQLNHVFADIYFGEIVSGIYDAACEAEYKVMLDIANDKFVSSQEYINLMKSRRADAMLFIASSISDDYLKVFETARYPFLLVNHFFPDSSLNYITLDYEDSAMQASDHLVNLGHRVIGVIAGTNTYTGLQFRDTFIDHCVGKGLKRKDITAVDGGRDWSQEDGYRAAEQLLAAHPKITAIMAGNDRMAVGAMSYVHSRKLKVPGDVSVIGVDDIPTARFSNPPLTTIQHPLYELGRLACEQVLAMFRNDIERYQEVVPVKLVIRESTGPVNKDRL